jgi:hypothetical protein
MSTGAKRTTAVLVEQWASVIGVPVSDWPGRCNEIAMAAMTAGLAPGADNRYGHYLGPVSRRWFSWGRQPFQRHGWLELPDGTIVDPTRWTLTGEDPFVYVGPNNDDYDWGGDRWRAAGLRTWPECNGDDAMHRLCQDKPVELTPLFVKEVIQREAPLFEMDDPEAPAGKTNATLRTCQAMWIANLPRSVLERVHDGAAVIRYLDRHGLSVFVPIDTMQWATSAATALTRREH